MNIGVFTNNYLPRLSGVPISVESFRKGLTALGHNVYIFAPAFRNYNDSNKNVFRFKSIDIKFHTDYPISVPYPLGISDEIEKLSLDIIHSQHPYILGKVALRYARRIGVPIVFTYHTRYEEYTGYIPIIPQRLLKAYAIHSSLSYANRCDIVISPTEQIKALLKAREIRRPVVVLPSGIDIDRFRRKGKTDSRKRYNIPQEAILILCVCRMAAEKNLDFLFDVLEKVLLKREHVMAMFVGDGPERGNLERRAMEMGVSNRVIFTGIVEQHEIPAYYDAGDIFIYSSLTETQGLVIVEAMASSLPVLAVDATGSTDIITDGVDGLLSPNNVEEFTLCLINLIDDRELRKKLAANAYETAKKYSIEATTKRLIEIYNMAVESSRSDYN